MIVERESEFAKYRILKTNAIFREGQIVTVFRTSENGKAAVEEKPGSPFRWLLSWDKLERLN